MAGYYQDLVPRSAGASDFMTAVINNAQQNAQQAHNMVAYGSYVPKRQPLSERADFHDTNPGRIHGERWGRIVQRPVNKSNEAVDLYRTGAALVKQSNKGRAAALVLSVPVSAIKKRAQHPALEVQTSHGLKHWDMYKAQDGFLAARAKPWEARDLASTKPLTPWMPVAGSDRELNQWLESAVDHANQTKGRYHILKNNSRGLLNYV